MARDLTAGFITEIDARELRAELLVNMEFDSGDVHFWTGLGSLVWDSNIYLGVGDLLSVGRIEESSVTKASGTTLILSGVKASLISTALNEDYQGRKAEIYFAVFTTSGLVVGNPYRIFAGKMDVMEIELTGETGSISVSIENELIDLFRANGRNYTPEDQKSAYPGDKGLDFIPLIQDTEIVWKEKL